MREHSPENRSLLGGQVALITGGGRGIGRAIAQTFAAAGAAVAVLARSAAELTETTGLIEGNGGRCLAFRADVTDSSGVRGAIQAIEKSLGPVDVLVNNAGTPKPFGPLWETDPGEWWRGMEVNLLGPLLCTRFVLPGMISRRRGRIISVASGAGAMAMTHFSSYVCSKTALVRFTECLALETKPHGIVAFAIAPGTVRTAMSEYSLNSGGAEMAAVVPANFRRTVRCARGAPGAPCSGVGFRPGGQPVGPIFIDSRRPGRAHQERSRNRATQSLFVETGKASGWTNELRARVHHGGGARRCPVGGP